jgi:hypothetical protein
MSLGVVAGRAWCCKLAGCYFLFISGRKKLVWYAGQRAQVRVAARVDSSSSGIRDGLGAGVEAARRKWRQVRRRGGGAKAAIYSWVEQALLGGKWDLRHRNRDGQRMDRGWASVLVLA